MTADENKIDLLDSSPTLEYLWVENYRALQSLELKNLTRFTVILGPNGSGKSTVFDVFAFLKECFTFGLRFAWEKRGNFREMRTRNRLGPIKLMLKYRERPDEAVITYYLAINETNMGPIVEEEWLQSEGPKSSRLLHFQRGEGFVLSENRATSEKLDSAELLAVNTLGQLAKYPQMSALRRFISDWHLSYLTANQTRHLPKAGSQIYLSQTGENLANVIEYFRAQHPQHLALIKAHLRRYIPRLEELEVDTLTDGRLLLLLKDAPFEQPVLAKYTSDGTLKMLAYLIMLYHPEPLALIGFEEPENHLHPRLLPELSEACRKATGESQLFVTTHSPFFINSLKAEELWVLYRNEQGLTQAKCVEQMRGIKAFMAEGALLGELWIEGYFEVGDPLTSRHERLPF
jgi:predicted ATPase